LQLKMTNKNYPKTNKTMSSIHGKFFFLFFGKLYGTPIN
jgi:hypothetical protein